MVELCTAYINTGGVDIEDVNFSNISAQNTDRCFKAFARNGAKIKNITLENIRSTSTTMNYLDCIEGEISNVNIRNVEIDYFDRATVMPESELAYRGNHLLSIIKANGVTLDGMSLKGTLYGVTEPVEIVDSSAVEKRNCNF